MNGTNRFDHSQPPPVLKLHKLVFLFKKDVHFNHLVVTFAIHH